MTPPTEGKSGGRWMFHSRSLSSSAACVHVKRDRFHTVANASTLKLLHFYNCACVCVADLAKSTDVVIRANVHLLVFFRHLF